MGRKHCRFCQYPWFDPAANLGQSKIFKTIGLRARIKHAEPGLLPNVFGGRERKMRAAKLVQYMKANADRMSEEMLQKIRKSEKCAELVRKLPAEEHKTYATNIYQDLTVWLATESDTTLERRYVALGRLRSQQEIPFSNLCWAVCIAHEHLWQYLQQECLLDEPVEFWGGVILLRSLTQFFNRVLYFALLGYEQSATCESQLSAAGSAEA